MAIAHEHRRRIWTALGAGAAAVLLAAAVAVAQDLKVTVTGSNIKRADNETASPIDVITRQDIERTGAISVNEVLQFIPSAGFAIDDRVTNGSTNGAGALNLRNLGFNSTLILLNGRRLPTYPFAQRTAFGSQAFQDLNAIPIQSVERIEILKDGVSAIYGADAVGGVVNIIQRKGYVGAEAGANAGITEVGDGKTHGVNGVLGFGDLTTDRYNVFVTMSYYKREAMLASGRRFAGNEDLRGRGGTDFRAAYGFPGTVVDLDTGDLSYYPTCDPAQVSADFCRYNRASFGGVSPQVERYNLSARGEFAIEPEASLFVELMGSRNKAYNLAFPAPSSDDPGIGSNVLPVGHPNNPFPHEALVFHRYADVGNRDTDSRGDMIRGVLGAKGAHRSWEWEAYASWNRIEIDEVNFNQVLAQGALDTINDRSYDFFDPFANSAATGRLRYDAFHHGRSRFEDYGIKASGEAWRLPAGPLWAAVGAQYTNLDVQDIPDPQATAGNTLGFGASAAFGEQSLAAVFGEIVVPVAKGLEASAALRYDRYSKSGDFSNTSPKFGVRWQPVPNLLLRATYSEAFRAPSIFETTTAMQSLFDFGLADPTRCITGEEPDCNLDVRLVLSGNPNLEPERSRVWNAGVVWDISPNASVSLDAYRIERKDEIGLFGTQTLINLFPNDPRIVVRSPLGTITTVNSIPVQLGKTTASGLDAELRLHIPMERLGTLQVRGQIAYVHDYTLTTIGGSGGVEDISFNGTYNYPRVRGAWDLAWLYGAHEVSLNGYYIHHYAQLNPTPSGSDVTAVGVWNLFWKWKADRNLSLTASMQNLLDTDPPFSNESSATNAGYNPSQSDPRGRAFNLGLNYRFK
jgi:iron complex outermembrane receptor protein